MVIRLIQEKLQLSLKNYFDMVRAVIDPTFSIDKMKIYYASTGTYYLTTRELNICSINNVTSFSSIDEIVRLLIKHNKIETSKLNIRTSVPAFYIEYVKSFDMNDLKTEFPEYFI